MKNNIKFYKKEKTKDALFWFYVFEYLKNKDVDNKIFKNNIDKKYFQSFIGAFLNDYDIFLKMKSKHYNKFEKEYIKNSNFVDFNAKKTEKWIKDIFEDKKFIIFLNKVFKFWNVDKKEFNKVNVNLFFSKRNFNKNKKSSGISFGSFVQKMSRNVIVLTFKKDYRKLNEKEKENFKKEILKIFVHEYSHCIQFNDKNNLKKILWKEVFSQKKYKKESEFFLKNPEIYQKLYLNILEIINHCISGPELCVFKYLYLKDFENPFKYNRDKLLENEKYIKDCKKRNKSNEFCLRNQVEYKIFNDIEKYFNENKSLDKKLVQKVVDLIFKYEKELK